MKIMMLLVAVVVMLAPAALLAETVVIDLLEAGCPHSYTPADLDLGGMYNDVTAARIHVVGTAAPRISTCNGMDGNWDVWTWPWIRLHSGGHDVAEVQPQGEAIDMIGSVILYPDVLQAFSEGTLSAGWIAFWYFEETAYCWVVDQGSLTVTTFELEIDANQVVASGTTSWSAIKSCYD